VQSVAVTAGGTQIVSGGLEGTVRVWNAETGAAVGEPLRGHDGWVWSVAVTADGTRIVSGCLGGTAREWDMATQKCLRTLSPNLSEQLSGDALLACVGPSATTSTPLGGPRIEICDGAILLTSEDGGSTTQLGVLLQPQVSCWYFDASRRILWLGLTTGGPVRVALVE
jgi:WD40 repeat protein